MSYIFFILHLETVSYSFYLWKLFFIFLHLETVSSSFYIWKLFLLLFTSEIFFFIFLHMETFSCCFSLSTFREKRIEENRNIIIKKLFDEELCSKLLCMTSRRKKNQKQFSPPQNNFSLPPNIFPAPKNSFHSQKFDSYIKWVCDVYAHKMG